LGVTRIADTSFLITLFDHRDARHGTAKEHAGLPEPIQVPPEVLGETLGVIHRRRGYAVAIGVWDELRSLPHVELVSAANPDATSRCFREGNGKLSWVDAAVVARCRALGASPLAFDKALEKAVRSKA
jgi:predicted nucleic acid-binding protein